MSNDPFERTHIPDGSDLQIYLRGKPFGYYVATGDDVILNMPTPHKDWWFVHFGSIGIEAFRAGDPATLWRTGFVNEIFSGWLYSATATPPQELYLLLSPGFSGVVKYRKNQFNEVFLYGTITKSSALIQDEVFATLPVGFLPKISIRYPATIYSPIGSTTILVHASGAVAIGVVNNQAIEVFINATFVASTGP